MARTLLAIWLVLGLGEARAGETREFPGEKTSLVEPPAPVEDDGAWSDGLLILMQYICIVLQCNEMRGDPENARSAAELWIATYEAGGVRTDFTAGQRLEALGVVQQLKSYVEGDPGVLPAGLRAELDGVLSSARADILQGVGS